MIFFSLFCCYLKYSELKFFYNKWASRSRPDSLKILKTYFIAGNDHKSSLNFFRIFIHQEIDIGITELKILKLIEIFMDIYYFRKCH